MSWAPYFHPSGEYLIFTTNKHGFANFELYLVAAEGPSAPVRVTYTDGFDGLPVFTPDGKGISWTATRTSNKKSQIFKAKWNHEKARELLGLDKAKVTVDTTSAKSQAMKALAMASASFRPEDMGRHVDYLCRPQLGGRFTGSRGEKLATAYVAAYLDSLGVVPDSKNGWFQEFEFPAGAKLGKNNSLSIGDDKVETKSWRPLSFSKTGQFKSAPVVFAGYGISAPKKEGFDDYDSYVHLDVKGKWVMMFRYMPENISPEMRQHLSLHSSLRYKAMVARDKGALGMIVVSGPNSKVKNQLVPLQRDAAVSGTSIGSISVTDNLANSWLQKSTGKGLGALQTKLDDGSMMMGFELKDVMLTANLDVKQVKKSGRNVIGRLVVGDKPSPEAILVGAHIDHLGTGPSSSSLAKDEDKNGIHFGADDNASGVAAMLEVAEYVANLKKKGKLGAKRDIIFAAWSGEEMGLHGSKAYVDSIRQMASAHGHGHGDPHADPHANPHAAPKGKANPNAVTPKVGAVKVGPVKPGIKKSGAANPHAVNPHAANPHAADPHAAAAAHAAPAKNPLSIYPYIAACLNMDMVGRFDKKLILQGIASSDVWRSEIEKRNAPVGLPITLQEDTELPTDASSFYQAGVPILSAFTGSHKDYHTPADTPEKLNYEKAAEIARLMGLITRGLAKAEKPPAYIEVSKSDNKPRAALRAYLGSVPDYGGEDIKGVKLSNVTKGAPSDKAGVKAGDIIVELAGRKIENIYDYTYAIEALKIGQKTKIVVQRGDKKITLEITPGSRD